MARIFLLATLGVALSSAGCADLTAPALEETSERTQAVATPKPAPGPQPQPRNRPKPRRLPPGHPPVQGEQVRASHILVMYKGSRRSRSKRSKAEARKLAEKVAKMATSGKDFAELAKQYSEGPSKTRGGDLGKFGRNRMAKPFEKAAFALKPGEVSGVVETQFGFHVIKRTE